MINGKRKRSLTNLNKLKSILWAWLGTIQTIFCCFICPSCISLWQSHCDCMKICRVMKYYVSLNFLPCIKRRRAINHRHVFFDSYRSLQLGSEVIALSLEISRVRHSLGKQEIQLSNYFKVLLIVSYYVCHWFIPMSHL